MCWQSQGGFKIHVELEFQTLEFHLFLFYFSPSFSLFSSDHHGQISMALLLQSPLLPQAIVSLFFQDTHLRLASCIYVATFFFFFFWEKHVSVTLCRTSESCVLFTRPTNFFFNNFFIKNGSHGIMHTFKNYFTTVFSVFNKISGIQMDPYSNSP